MEPFTSDLMSVEQAQQLIADQVTPLTDHVTVATTQALGRVTAEAVVSPINVPSFDNSAMDGYALRLSDLAARLPLPIAGQSFAGKPFTGHWPEKSVIQIMTGALIPSGTEAVIMQEQTQRTATGIMLTAEVEPGKNIRRIGGDVRIGQQVLAAGVRLAVKDLPLLASLGISQVSVKRQLQVAIFSTGDELVAAGLPLSNGQIYDTNRFAIQLMLERLGCEVIDLGIIPDDKILLRQTFLEADHRADLVISTGGVSVGEADYTRDILTECGDIKFWKLAMKPGKPFAFGNLKNSLFCGLPGNPVSAVVTFCQLVYPLIARLQGLSVTSEAYLLAKLENDLIKQPGRTEFQRGYYKYKEGVLSVRVAEKQGSHMLSTFTQANCFVVIDRDQGSATAGEQVTIQPFPDFLQGY